MSFKHESFFAGESSDEFLRLKAFRKRSSRIISEPENPGDVISRWGQRETRDLASIARLRLDEVGRAAARREIERGRT